MTRSDHCHLPHFHAYRRDVGIHGTEVVDVVNFPHEFRWFTSNYGVTVPITWSGDIVYRGRRHAMQPGLAFCNEPGEVVTSRRPFPMGAFRAFGFEPETFREQLQEHGIQAGRWRHVAPIVSVRLSKQLGELFGLLYRPATPMQLQTSTVEVIDVLLRELVDGASPTPAPIRTHDRVAERIRECLQYEDDASLDLKALSDKLGMSRFHVVRTFKRHYGLPPCAYQLCMRVGRAREMLKTGASPADVAARFGFVDQSHFIRHFKRIVGVTPSHYAACVTRKSSLELGRVAGGSSLTERGDRAPSARRSSTRD